MDALQVRTAFSEDVKTGLSAVQKYIPSKYFYDEEGSRLFSRIMRTPEYYLTGCEYEILRDNAGEIYRHINHDDRRFDLIELGAGDGLKTSLLLSHFLHKKADFKYIPVDISIDALLGLVRKLRLSFPGLMVSEVAGDYFEILEDLNLLNECRKVSLFLGSNIGNYTPEETLQFFSRLSSVLNRGDMIISGFDLVKAPDIILRAYNDAQGYTRAFNFNLLNRINEELGANIELSGFHHVPVYDPAEHTAKSYLVSNREQDIYMEAMDFTIHLDKWESILTEISHKFTIAEVERIAEDTGFRSVRNFTDKRGYYLNALWEKV